MSFPAYVQTAEDMRRHELVVRAALITFGWDTDDESTVLDHNDRMMLAHAIPTLYHSDNDTGEGHITDRQRCAMTAMGLL